MGTGQIPVQWKPSSISDELRSKNHPKAVVVPSVLGIVVVAVSGTAILGGIVPRAAADDAVRALWYLTFFWGYSAISTFISTITKH